MKYIIATLVICIIILLIINVVDLNRYVVRNVAIYDAKIGQRLKVCFLTDLHNYSCTPKFFEDIREYNPDLIICGGDIITATPGRSQKNAYEFLEKVSAIAPTVMALGNHEYRAKIYPEKYGKMYEELTDKLNELGIEIISNSHKDIEGSNVRVSASEIDRLYYKRFKLYPMGDDYIESIVGKIDKEKYNILLAHNPDYFKQYNAYGSDLILSGHVHGGLIRLPFVHGVAHPGIKLFPKYSGGAYDDNGKFVHYADSYVSSKNSVIRLIVGCGIGYHTLPLRLFNPGELIFISLDSKK